MCGGAGADPLWGQKFYASAISCASHENKMAAATCAVRFGAEVRQVPRGTTPQQLQALLQAPCALLVLVHTGSSDDPGAYSLARVPGLAPLLPQDSKTRYLRLLREDEALGPAMARLHFPPAAAYALPASAELLLLAARAQLSWEGGGGGMGMGVPPAPAAEAAGSGGSGGRAPPGAPAGPLFSHAALLVLATLENAARVSPEFQVLFGSAERDEYNQYQQATWMELCSELQYALVWLALGHRAAAPGDADLAGLAAPPALLAEAVLHAINAAPSARVAAAFAAGLAAGASPRDAVRGVHALRTAGNAYPATIGMVSLYWRYNRVDRGRLRDGAPAPDADLVGLDGAPTSLHALIAAHHPLPLLVLAGSYS